MSTDTFIHPLADVQTDKIGHGTRIWQFVVVLPGASIGADVNICSHCFIENDVIIGDRVTIKIGVQLWDGLRVADDVFVGPNVTFTNDRYPKSRNKDADLQGTVIEKGAVIGAGAVICPGLTVGAGSMVAAGATVVHDVPAGVTVYGNPAGAKEQQV
jgi:acetyltransferase-like isoleucine patch superfamily enzyme